MTLKQRISNLFNSEKNPEEEFKQAVLLYYEHTLNDAQIKLEVKTILFDKEYEDFIEEPYKHLLRLYKRASYGDESVLQDTLFRKMRLNRNKNALKLDMIIKTKLK